MTERIEQVILENLIGDDEYARKVLPFLSDEYFDSKIDKLTFKEIQKFFNQHNKLPNKKILKLNIEDSKELKQEEYEEANHLIDSLSDPEPNKIWLVERTEKFCKDKALFNGIMTAISVFEGRNTKFNKDAIPNILQEALSVSFDKTIGHSYFDDAESRYDFYHLKEDRVPFGLKIFNKITKGGLPRKTLSIAIASTGVGKSLFMCDYAAACLRQGYNVLYITMEMAEQRIAERIDCNLMNKELNEIERMSVEQYRSNIDEIKQKTQGKLIVKEYPTSGAHVGHFKALMDELSLKKNFKPDIVFVDYLNICVSQRYKGGGNANSYTIIKSIAEELRGFAVEFDVPVLSATQTNREGFSNTDVELTNTSESIGLPATVDFMFAIMRTEELDAMGQLMIKQLKSRFNDINYFKRFTIGIELSKFKLHDVDDPAAGLVDAGITDDGPPSFDNTKFGSQMIQRGDVSNFNFD